MYLVSMRCLEALPDNCPQMEIDGPLLSVLKDDTLNLAGDLSSIKEFEWFPVFVLEQLTEVGSSPLGSSACFFHLDTAGEWRDASVPDSPSHLSQSALAGFGLAGTPTAQWRSCEPNQTRVYSLRGNTLFETHIHTHTHTHTHRHTRFRRAEVCAFLITPVTWKHYKVESICLFPLSYMSTLMPFLKRENEREGQFSTNHLSTVVR